MINRSGLILGTTLLYSGISTILSKKISKYANIVVIGGGWGGLSDAKTLKYLNSYYNKN